MRRVVAYHFVEGNNMPSLVRTLREPMRQIIGDLSDVDRTLAGLQLHAVRREAE